MKTAMKFMLVMGLMVMGVLMVIDPVDTFSAPVRISGVLAYFGGWGLLGRWKEEFDER